MKIRYALLFILAPATTLFAWIFVSADNSKPPTVSLPAAYERALTAIGPATNKFHCISTTISTVYSRQGGLCFTFTTPNRPPEVKRVTVDFDGAVHVRDQIPKR